MAQSRTAVNDKAAKGEGSMDSIGHDVTPGNVASPKHDMGGPTNQNERPDDNSTKLNIFTPGQSRTAVNDKAKSGEGSMESVPDSVLPYPSSYNGSKPGRTGGSESMDSLDQSIAYGATTKGSPSAAVKTVVDGMAEQHVEIDNVAKENLDELSTAQNASDDFKMKAKVIFESALNEKLKMEVTRLEEEFSSRFEQEITDIAEKVEGFLNYTSQQWLEENQLVVENGIRNELSESFMKGLKGLFEDHYVTLPDEKYDVFESMVAKLDDMENKLNEQIEQNVVLSSSMSEFQRQAIVAEAAWDLSEAGKEKLARLSESVEFESEDHYRQKLSVLKESFAGESQQAEATYLEESSEPLQPTIYDGMSNSMAAYAAALTRTVNN
jgi:hypothetical protein